MVITISRTYGSGGKQVGKALAAKLGYKFYDKDLCRILSDETGINEGLFGESDEKLTKTYIGTDVSWKKNAKPLPPSSKKYSSEKNLFKLQAEKIKKLASEGNCIIMGRCADKILEGNTDIIRLYCYASRHDCIKRTMEVCEISEKDAVKRIESVDKYRNNYYKHFTGKKLSDSENYDLCVNTGSMPVADITDFVCQYIEAQQHKDTTL